MHCGEFEKSADQRFGAEDQAILTTMAKRYISDNPVTPYTFRVSSTNGIKRDLDYRYDMEMTSRFPDMRSGEYVYAHAKLWSNDEQELPFSLSCYGPVTVYLNKEQAYQANIEEEVFPQRRSWFRLKLKQGWNYFVWQFMRTGTGCGATFGSGSIKGFPLHFIVPFGEAEGAEGILYTAPITDRRAQYGDYQHLQEDHSLAWYPKMSWSKDDMNKQPLSTRLLGESEARVVLAWTSVHAEQQGTYELVGRFGGKLLLYCNGEQGMITYGREQEGEGEIFKADLKLQQGTNQLWLWMVEQAGADPEWISLMPKEQQKKQHDLDEISLLPQLPIQVEGYKGNFLFSGPYEEPLAVEEVWTLMQMSKLHSTTGDVSYWRADMPDSYVRPFSEQTHFGRWNYPLGVTLYGLLRLKDETAENYALQHIESCTAYYQYAHWDAQLFGAPGINHQLVGMDSLDDCGSFGATMLVGHSIRPLHGAEQLAADIAHYMTSKQSRLKDGTLYRIKGSTAFMMDTMWCDDLYMSVPFLLRYSLISEDRSYINDAIHQLLQYKQYLFEPELGIMHHVFDLKFNKANGAYWGRGNGWVLFSLAELLRHVQPEHERYSELLHMYRQLSNGYLALQGANGLWHQVLDDHESYEESSCTSMFAYAFAIGVREGWLTDEKPYIDSVERAWQGLKQRAIDEAGNVYGVCRGSGFAHHSYYYKHDLMPRLNDTHGIGIIMLAGIEAGILKQWQAKHSEKTVHVKE